MYTDGAQCTANFVYTDAAGTTYVGYAAHCAGPGAATDTDGCQHRVPAARHPGHLQRGRQPGRRGHPGRHRHPGLQQLADHAEHGEKDPNTCAYNDLALVKVDAGDVGKVEPLGPVLGRPDRHRHRRHRRRRPGLHLRQLQPARRVEQLAPHTGVEPRRRRRGRRLVAPGLHRDPGHPRRLGQRLPRAPTARPSACCPRSRWLRCRPPTASATSPRSSATRRPTPGSPG